MPKRDARRGRFEFGRSARATSPDQSRARRSVASSTPALMPRFVDVGGEHGQKLSDRADDRGPSHPKHSDPSNRKARAMSAANAMTV